MTNHELAELERLLIAFTDMVDAEDAKLIESAQSDAGAMRYMQQHDNNKRHLTLVRKWVHMRQGEAS